MIENENDAQGIINQYFENSIDLLCIADTEGHFIKLNQEWERTLGYSLSELEGRSYVELVHPDDVDNTVNATFQLAGDKKVFNFINRYKHKNGSYRWIEWRSYPSKGYIYANARDITDRKQAEEELSKLNSLQTAILDNAGYAIIAMQKDGLITTFNKSAEEILGYSAKEVLGKQTPVFFHDWQEIVEETNDLNKTYGLSIDPGVETFMAKANMNIPSEREWVYISKTKEHIPVFLKITALKDIAGFISGYVGIAIDLRKQKKEQELAKEKEILLRDYYQIAKLGGYKLNIGSGNWISTEILDEIFGIDNTYKKDVEGWRQILHPEFYTSMNYYLSEFVVKQGNSFDKEYKIIRYNDKQERWMHGKGELERDAHGKPLIMIGTIQDITERKQKEEALRLSEQKYRLLFENMTSGFALHEMIYDGNGRPADYRYIEANPAFEKLTGLPVKEIIGKTIKEIVPNIEDYWVQVYGGVALKGKPISYLNAAKELGGKYFDTYVFSPEKDKFAVIFNDITERIKAENELKISEQKFSNFYNLTLDMVGITRLSDGLIIDVNPTMVKISGYSREELIGHTTLELKLWNNSTDRKIIEESLKEKGEIKNFEARMGIKNGNNISCLFSAKLLTYNDEPAMLFVLNDISERKKAEDKIRESEQKYRLLFENMNSAFAFHEIITDENNEPVNFKFIDVNQKYKQLWDVDDTIIGQPITQVFDKVKKNWIIDAWNVIKSGIPKFKRDYLPDKKKYIEINEFKIDDRHFAIIFNDITEKVETENIIQETRKFNDALIESVPGLVYMYNHNGYLVKWNKRHEEDTGYSAEELSDMYILDWYKGSENDIRTISEGLEKVAKEGFGTAEAYLQKKDGTKVPYYFSATSINLEGKDYFTGIGIDITERKKTEEALIKSQRMLQESQRVAHIGSWELDVKTNQLTWNEESYRIFGFEPLEIEPTFDILINLVHEEDRWLLPIHYEKTILSKKFKEIEYRIVLPDGTLKYLNNIGEVSIDDNGNVYRMFGIVQDITERKITEDIIRESEQLYRNLIEMSPDGISLSNLLGNLIMVNNQMAKLAGYSSAEELVDKNIFELVDPDDWPLLRKTILDLFDHKYIDNVHLTYLRKDGTRYIAEYRASMIHDSNGNPTAFMSVITDITEKKKADIDLHETKERLQSFMDSATEAFTIWDKDLRLIDLNKNAMAYAPHFPNKQDFLGMHISDFLPYLKNNMEDNIYINVLKTGKSFEGEDIIQLGSKKIFLYARIFMVGDGLGMVTSDITEQKLVERLIREKDAKVRSIFLAAPVAIGLTINRIFKEVNETFFKMTGYSSDEIIGHTARLLYVNEEDYQYVGDKLIGEFIEKKQIIVETRWKRKDGRIIEVLLSFVPLDWEDVSKEFTFTALDITERKQYEEALKKRVLALTRPLSNTQNIELTDLFNIDDLQKIQDTFANATGVASIITYPDGTPITKPSNFCKLCNLIRSTGKGMKNCYKSDAYIGMQSPEGATILPCLSGGLWDAGASITIGGVHIANWLIGQVRMEVQDENEVLKYADIIGADRDEFKRYLNEVPFMPREQFQKVSDSLFILAKELSLKAYQNVQQARFISEQQQSEEEIIKLNAELEKKVEERTAKLNQANKELESFAYSVSHDLRAPLRHIDGFVRLLNSKINSQDEIINGYFAKINDASKRMAVMIDDLLSFSRLGRKDVSLSEVNLNSIIEEILEQSKPDICDRAIKWEIGKISLVRGDKNLLKIVFDNLISNAIKYTAKKQIAYIQIGEGKSDEQNIVIFVKDNGVGFDMAYENKLFGVFQRLHGSEEFEGTGIGLANVKQIIKKHNGQIRAEGKVNEGAIFYITLPK